MDTKDLEKAARAICTKHNQRAVIILAIGDGEIVWKGWSKTGAEQKVTDALSNQGAQAILDTLNASREVPD